MPPCFLSTEVIDLKVKNIARRLLAEGGTEVNAVNEMLGGDAFALVFGHTPDKFQKP